MRKRIRNKTKDKKIFRNTANKTKAVNIPKLSMRGGIRF